MKDEARGQGGADAVRCLNCRHIYEKPTRGGTAQRNPGCPRCGYVGWLSAVRTAPAGPRLYGSTAL
jgi:hypothetical protein